MRITKTIAEDVADKLVAKLTERLKEIEIEFGQILNDEWVKRAPKEVLTTLIVAPEYIKTKSSGYIHFLGRTVYCTHDKSFPHSSSDLKIENTDLCNRMSALENEKIDLKKKKAALHKEFSSTLLQLGTTNKIAEHLPEAIPFLPEESKVPAINFTDTRNKLKEIL